MYKNSYVHESGIYAKCVAASIGNGVPIYTLEICLPKYLDAECLTGDTLLHFERQAKPGQQCLATMSIEEFYDKWTNGITKSVDFTTKYINLDPKKYYSIADIAKLNNITPEALYHLRKKYDEFPKTDSILGNEFNNFISTQRSYKSSYKNILNKMKLRCYDFESGMYTTTSVVDIWESGTKRVYRIIADNSEIKASENHYFLTQRGWVKVKDLLLNDSLVRISHVGKKEVPKNYLSFNRAIKPELLELQNYKCYDCNAPINNSNDVHHIIPVTVQPELWNNKNNVICLCAKCHTQRHIELGYTSLSPTLTSIDSIEYYGEELTYDLQVEHRDSNFVANGFVVHNCEKHRMLSSNSSSSRAVPFGKINSKFLPPDLRKNGSGMQGEESLCPADRLAFHADLLQLYDDIYDIMEYWSPYIHKQHINRYLEPWTLQKKVVTATEWDNFFSLRLAKDAQPEMQILARLMDKSIKEVTPVKLKTGEWHLPYIQSTDDVDIKVSVARCARVSYLNHDNTTPNRDKDLELYGRLLSSGHWSAFEHCATPMQDGYLTGVTHTDMKNRLWSGNFRSWVQFRQLVNNWN